MNVSSSRVRTLVVVVVVVVAAAASWTPGTTALVVPPRSLTAHYAALFGRDTKRSTNENENEAENEADETTPIASDITSLLITAIGEELEQQRGDPCSTRACHATFPHAFSVPVTIPCSTASGAIPSEAKLPLVYPGDYGACEHKYAPSAKSHYCTIDTGYLLYPLHTSPIHYTGEGLVLGPLHLGRCVPQSCTASHLRDRFVNATHAAARRWIRTHPLATYVPFVEMSITSTLQVRCVDEDQRARGSVWDRTETAVAALVVVLVVGAVLLASALTALDVVPTATAAAEWTRALSLQKSMAGLVAPMQGDFAFLNGVRVVSMVWVEYGHVVLYSAGLALPFPVANLAAMDAQLQSPIMTLSRGAEYSVDTFFFMSGFLATWGTLQEFSKAGALEHTPRKWFPTMLHHAALRYARLTPVYAFVLMVWYLLWPFAGTGPFFDRAMGRAVRNEECKDWWSNLLMLNNLVPFGEDGGLRGCMGWSWYLANDFQFSLLVVPLVAWYASCRARFEPGTRRWVASLAPCLAIVAFQVAITAWTVQHWDIRGAFDPNFNVHLYVKPWCRIAPHIVGVAFALWHFERTSVSSSSAPCANGAAKPDAWKTNVFHGFLPEAVALTAFAVTSTIVFAPFDQMRCRADDPNDCNVWGALAIFGALAAPNWSRAQLTAYFSLTYAAWAVSLGAICFYFFSGRGGVVQRVMAWPGFTPLARLTFTAYLVHIPIISWWFLTQPMPTVVSATNQFLDTLAVVAVSYSSAFVLFLFVERPALSLITMRKAARRPEVEARVSRVADHDSEVVVVGSPTRPPSSVSGVGVDEPLLRAPSLNGSHS